MLYAASAIIIYYLAFLTYYRTLYPSAAKRYVPLLASLLCITALYATERLHGYYWTFFSAVTVALILGIRFSTAMNTLQAICGGLASTLSAYCFRGILTGVYILAFHSGEPDALINLNIYYGITMVALPVSLVYFFIVQKTVLPGSRMMYVLNSSQQTKSIIAYQILVSAFLLILNQGRFTSTDTKWYVEIAMGACILSLYVLVYVTFRAGELIETLQYKWRSELLEEQYAMQIRHYHTVEKYTVEIRRFRHDFRAAISALTKLLELGDITGAKRLLEEMQTTIQGITDNRQKYSGHVVLDAMLQDLAAVCAENRIRCTFRTAVPRNTQLSLLDGIRIFRNLTDNAVEACQKVSVEKRFLEITTADNDDWTTLHIRNAYDGQLLTERCSFLPSRTVKDMGLAFLP